jgi:hypothetical protein
LLWHLSETKDGYAAEKEFAKFVDLREDGIRFLMTQIPKTDIEERSWSVYVRLLNAQKSDAELALRTQLDALSDRDPNDDGANESRLALLAALVCMDDNPGDLQHWCQSFSSLSNTARTRIARRPQVGSVQMLFAYRHPTAPELLLQNGDGLVINPELAVWIERVMYKQIL